MSEQRSDARRNRQRLVSAAAEAFATVGTEASVADIAERAGVGKGTVFRHFASKDELLGTIVGDVLDTLLRRGEDLTTAPDAAAALEAFMSETIELQAHDRAFCEVVAGTAVGDRRIRESIAALEDVVARLTARAQSQGALRPDVTGDDIVLLLSGIYQTAAPLSATRPELWRRYLALALDGLQTSAARTALPAAGAP
ncbi:TetR/AcrR family transcriptional regulator [Herbiconiux daphne]|uniref:TetR/AcrR family transcriptional regulator n=1 Tax=Herbiconiux daphne TaxID=2970914 RepID=A0ABT2H455_9MICO|nr:TetR/AcrR family transcriptional regulator [Herbiconiux daphne]MCS5734715.1 TetR/AcrR family transcriptional regulator [Herbiconiux daphne]